jgi:hypothetical protein
MKIGLKHSAVGHSLTAVMRMPHLTGWYSGDQVRQDSPILASVSPGLEFREIPEDQVW